MRIGIIGNYGHDNNGDEAILTGLIHQLILEKGIKKENITVFSNNPENTKARHGVYSVPLLYKKSNTILAGIKTIIESRKVMRKLDLLIIGGGGLLMDMYTRDAPLYTTLGMVGRWSGCTLAVHGVGAGPINTKLGSFLIKRLIKAASVVSVRDEKSKQLLRKKGITKDIHVVYDPAFSVPSKKVHQKSERITKAALTALPYFSDQYWPVGDAKKYRAYVETVASELDALIEEMDLHLTFFSTKFPEDVETTEDIAKQMKHGNQVVINKDNLSPQELVHIAAEQDIVIGTRLHSLILSMLAETPVIGLEYHHKVADFMALTKNESTSIKMEQIADPEKGLAAQVKRINKDWINVQEQTVTVSKHLKDEAKKGMELLPAER